MIPNSSLYEHLMFERRKLLQREAQQRRMLAGLPPHRRIRHLFGRLSTCFVALETSMQQLEQPDQPTGAWVRKTVRLVERTGA
jgi:hypothetical protein